ncbi:MAG: hypothetical protein ACR2P8_08290 [Myxococcota bacterium]
MSQPATPAEAPAAPSTASRTGGLRLPVWSWLTIWMVVFVGGPVAAHAAMHGVVNGWQLALSFFLAINLLICIWEISLWHRIRDIRRWFHMPIGDGDRPRGNLYTMRISPREFWSTRLWARTWLGYTHWDDGYADPKSCGFAIDVGNGFSTLIPSVLFLIGMTFPIFSPAVLGIVGLLIFYQKFYGTCLYFFQYLYNRRYRGRPLSGVLGVVGGTNGLWFVFPAFGLYVCVRLILENRFDILWS